MQTKDIQTEIKALDNGLVEGYALTYDIDRVGDKIQPGAARFDKKAKVLWQHQWDKPIGLIENVIPDSKGVKIQARLLIDQVSTAKEAYEMVKAGLVDSFSIGYVPNKAEYDDNGIRHLKELDVFEVSLVTIPANPQASVTSVKAVPKMKNWPLADRERSWDASAAVKRIRAATNSEENPSEEYKFCFFWYDFENADNFTAYKLPYCDVIDGKIHAIPRAIFAAAAAVNGARGGVDIPKDDLQKVKNVISRWYKRMAQEFDDPSLVAPWDREKGMFPTIEEFMSVHCDEIKTMIELERLAKKLGGK